MVDSAAHLLRQEVQRPNCREAICHLQTGLFVHEKTDLIVPDIVPIRLTHTYRNEDSFSRAFGRGTNHPYDIFFTNTQGCFCYNAIELILPDGGRVRYDRISSGGGFSDAIFEATKSPTLYKSRVHWNGTGWDLTFKDGTVWIFPENAPIKSIRDRYGNLTNITRTSGSLGNIQRITSPNGRYIGSFTTPVINYASERQRRTHRKLPVRPSGRWRRVTDPMNGVTEYT
jgi:hypothetical protein